MADYLTAYLLVVLDMALYLLLAYRLLGRTKGSAGPLALSETFAALGTEIRRAIPSLPPGFTWEEAMAAAKRLRLDVDWPRVDRAVAAYEGYRYGGREDPRTGYEEIQVLTRRLKGRR